MALPMSVYVPKHLNFYFQEPKQSKHISCHISSCENHDRGLSTKIYKHKEGKMNKVCFLYPSDKYVFLFVLKFFLLHHNK